MAKRKLSAEALEYFREQGRKGGKIGGKVRMEKLTPEQRSAIAKKASIAAVAAREAKRKKAKKQASSQESKKQ
jgi:hypothetical protein